MRYADTYAKDRFVIGSLLIENRFDAPGALHAVVKFVLARPAQPAVVRRHRVRPPDRRGHRRTGSRRQAIPNSAHGFRTHKSVHAGGARRVRWTGAAICLRRALPRPSSGPGRSITVADLFGVTAPLPLVEQSCRHPGHDGALESEPRRSAS
ncbi:MAG: hypothetical protein WKG07_20795 [Hymenobacter sp.]